MLVEMLITALRMVSVMGNCPITVSREEWEAQPPKQIEEMINPVPYVIIHHTYIPAVCNTSEECVKSMRGMQKFHQVDNGWNDIGYSFCIGGDGKVYTGRGWDRVGAHAPKFNDKSIGICLIGDYRFELPSEVMLQATKDLISCGINTGRIQANYTLLAHRQVRDTECPGDALYKEVQLWPHWSETP